MRFLFMFLALPYVIGCDVVQPTTLAGSVDDIAPEAFVNATVSVLHEEGYTVLNADRIAGLVTSDWRDESSFASQVLLDVSRRTRISVVFDFYTHNVSVQMTKQKKLGDDAWRNDGLSDNDRARMRQILVRIQTRAQAIANQEALSST